MVSGEEGGGDRVKVALVDCELHDLVKSGAFECGVRSLEEYVQPASIDIPIGRQCFLLRDKVLPFKRKVDTLLEEEELVLSKQQVEQGGKFLLLRGQTYLFPCGSVKLGPEQFGSLSPKSSIGRVDLMVRGIFDECGLYDTITGEGSLWMEVTPRSFNVSVREGQALSQLMVFETRRASDVTSTPAPLPPLSKEAVLSFDELGNQLPLHVHRGMLVLSLDVAPFKNTDSGSDVDNDSSAAATAAAGAEDKQFLVGYEAIPTSAVLDLSTVKANCAADFFRPVYRNPNKMCVTLEKDKFYILSTKERIAIPTHLSAEMVPFSQHVGELRAHYAGFFDPGFGYGREGEIKGTAGVLEVRPHETITVYDGQPICLMEFFNNSKPPKEPYGFAQNHYQNQRGPRLAKYFYNA